MASGSVSPDTNKSNASTSSAASPSCTGAGATRPAADAPPLRDVTDPDAPAPEAVPAAEDPIRSATAPALASSRTLSVRVSFRASAICRSFSSTSSSRPKSRRSCRRARRRSSTCILVLLVDSRCACAACYMSCTNSNIMSSSKLRVAGSGATFSGSPCA
ncbi:hypothetical protein BC828DRAFT_381822 [Blastocladiella britannica]|nr:hypothetical protein BC828DRAFT_381822 [Blastocladiella britannica]